VVVKHAKPEVTRLMRIAVVTNNPAVAEPRALRHAIAARLAFPESEIVLIDAVPDEVKFQNNPNVLLEYNIRHITLRYPTRKQLFKVILSRVRMHGARFVFRLFGILSGNALGHKMHGLDSVLAVEKPSICIGHNIETLVSAGGVLRYGGMLIFDCMEFYSDMGDGQSEIERMMTIEAEKRLLPRCSLVISSGPRVSEALVRAYGIQTPLSSYNVPPLKLLPDTKPTPGLRLYWRNFTLGFGQRGLEDALVALSELPDAVSLTLQGNLALDGGRALRDRIAALGLHQRVTVAPPHAPGQAMEAAVLHDVGLCLERKGPLNHELTVSNKMFDYHMAGLATVASDLPSLRDVIQMSEGGILYEPGNAIDLARAIRQLLYNPRQLADMRRKARSFAEQHANLELELNRLATRIRGTVVSVDCAM
jgi:glycosyltransferase involved in cell wall biosynthesis